MSLSARKSRKSNFSRSRFMWQPQRVCIIFFLSLFFFHVTHFQQNSAPKRSETEMVNKMVDHSKTKSSKNSTCKNSNKVKNRDVQEKREKQGSSRMKSLRKKQSLLRMVQSGAGCYSKGPLTPILDESPTTSRSSTPISMKKLKPMEKYESEDEVNCLNF
jgi:hypothetical protein